MPLNSDKDGLEMNGRFMGPFPNVEKVLGKTGI
jgi:hypothetical protein